jgi:toxin HigB-1
MYRDTIQIAGEFGLIVSFANKRTEAIAEGSIGKGFAPDLVKRAQWFLSVLDSAQNINDLRSPPGNRLEKLSGDRTGQHSIRINDKWRICFTWTVNGAEKVEIVDYH